jgi:hypothetical protein
MSSNIVSATVKPRTFRMSVAQSNRFNHEISDTVSFVATRDVAEALSLDFKHVPDSENVQLTYSLFSNFTKTVLNKETAVKFSDVDGKEHTIYLVPLDKANTGVFKSLIKPTILLTI